MKKLFMFIKAHKLFIISLILFSLGIAAVMFFMPNEKKFEFEYQQNKVWLHEDLYAPFGFSIDKTEDEIQAQRDSVMIKFSPYYTYDSTVYEQVVNSIYEGYLRNLYHIVSDSVVDYQTLVTSQGLSEFDKLLRTIYDEGIIDVQKPYKTLIVE